MRVERHVGCPTYRAAMTNREPMVEGEPARLILEALIPLMENSRTKDGMTRWEGPLIGDSGAALIHALGRITAELHAADMRSFLPGGSRNHRTEEQRGADALLILIERASEALGIDTPLAPGVYPYWRSGARPSRG